MTVLSKELIALNELQDQFESVACNVEITPFRKVAEMQGLLGEMVDVLEKAELVGSYMAADAAEHILDFICRYDLSGKWIDAAFGADDAQSRAFRQRLERGIESLQESAEGFDRMKYERFSLPPEIF